MIPVLTGRTARADERARFLRQRMTSLARSLETYWAEPGHLCRLSDMYAPFVREGDLVFDIGAHVGDRVFALRQVGARVVAVEPQADCCAILQELFAGDEDVKLINALCGSETGTTAFHINAANATVSTASADFVRAAADADGWREQSWDLTVEMRSTTLDQLIAEHGEPVFAKIDVEGYEHEVLRGLGRPIAALSFEFTTIQRDVAKACLERLEVLGNYRFNYAIGETQALAMPDWCDGPAMAAAIAALPHDANSGDVYARLENTL